MKNILTVCLGAALFTVIAQKQACAQTGSVSAGSSVGEFSHVIVDGEVVKGNSYSFNSDISGSPFFLEDWADGVIINDKGDKFKAVLKFDAYRNQLLVPGKDDAPMTVSENVVKFSLGDLIFANGFPALDKATNKTFYQVLNEGTTVLLKRQVIKVLEERDVAGIVVAHKYENTVQYYLYKNGKINTISTSKGSILAALNDKPQTADYLKNNKIDFKKDADLGKLFTYYNTL